MGLSYNRDTSVERDVKTRYELETEFLNQENIVGRESQIQTKKFSKYLTAPSTFTLTEDIILTGISLTAYAPVASGYQETRAWINVNTEIIGICRCESSPAGATSNTEENNIYFPNWFLPAGTILGCSESGGDESTVTFIGYLA